MVVITLVTSPMVAHSSVTVVMVMKVINAKAVLMVFTEYQLRYDQQRETTITCWWYSGGAYIFHLCDLGSNLTMDSCLTIFCGQ